MKHRNLFRRFIAVCLIVCTAAVLLAGCGGKGDDIDANTITTKLENVSELATAKLTMKNLIHFTEGEIPFINKKEFYMIYSASVKAGFDLSKAKIEVTDDKLVIDLPEVVLLDVNVDEKSLEFFDKSDSIFNREDMEDTAEAITAAKENLMAQPEIDELKKSASNQVQSLLKGLLESQIGNRELVINIGS